VLSRCNAPGAILSTVKTGLSPIQFRLRELLPSPTVRWRLTLLYSLIFLGCGTALLAITYWLFSNYAYTPPKEPNNPVMLQLLTAMSVVRSNGLHRLQLYSGIALAIMAFVSVVLGWLVAGRVLAPLRTITATADRISDTNLHERLAMPGPRDELRLLADTIDRLLARLEAAFNAQRRFVANASHELRTPLAMMRTTLDVAIAKPEGMPPQTRELDAELRVDLDHADQLLESFLTLARAENGQLDEREQVALEPIIRCALSDRVGQIADRELTVQADLEAVEVLGSPTLVRRMIENLIENAVRHTEPGGLVLITLATLEERQARVSLDSSGPILNPDAVSQLAQPFKRLSRDRTGAQDGHGLGLSIVAAVAAAHGGQLDLQARAQGGLRVQIMLPAATISHLVG
jgi:signal transduction histidine kinase